ncbi:MAG: hypothetical protein ACTHOO_11395 [Alcanivorax sp.]
MEHAKRGGFLDFLKNAYDEANKGHEDESWVQKLRNAYHFTVEYPAVVNDAISTDLMMAQTPAGLRLAIEDTLNDWNKHKADDIARYGERYMRQQIADQWEDADQRAEIIQYLKERDHQRRHDVPSDFDRAQDQFPFAVSNHHMQTMNDLIESQMALDSLVHDSGRGTIQSHEDLAKTISLIEVQAQNARIFGPDGLDM